jgi:hypothetical protein
VLPGGAPARFLGLSPSGVSRPLFTQVAGSDVEGELDAVAEPLLVEIATDGALDRPQAQVELGGDLLVRQASSGRLGHSPSGIRQLQVPHEVALLGASFAEHPIEIGVRSPDALGTQPRLSAS